MQSTEEWVLMMRFSGGRWPASPVPPKGELVRGCRHSEHSSDTRNTGSPQGAYGGRSCSAGRPPSAELPRQHRLSCYLAVVPVCPWPTHGSSKKWRPRLVHLTWRWTIPDGQRKWESGCRRATEPS